MRPRATSRVGLVLLQMPRSPGDKAGFPTAVGLVRRMRSARRRGSLQMPVVYRAEPYRAPALAGRPIRDGLRNNAGIPGRLLRDLSRGLRHWPTPRCGSTPAVGFAASSATAATPASRDMSSTRSNSRGISLMLRSRSRPCSAEAQHPALSRQRHGFESRQGRHPVSATSVIPDKPKPAAHDTAKRRRRRAVTDTKRDRISRGAPAVR